jgi:anti-sigma-K factor RskA
MSAAPRQRWDDASVGEYALGVMPHAERMRFAADLQEDPLLQQRLLLWEENLAPMANELTEVAPPPHLFEKIESRVFGETKPKSLSLFQRLGFWQAATATGFAALALVIALPFFTSLMPPAPVENAPLVAVIEGETLLLAARYNAVDGTLNISRKRGLEAPNEDFELWVIAAGGTPVSVGVLLAGDTTLIRLPDALKPVIAGATLAITNESDGGSPSGKPTGSILGTGIVVEI